MDYASIQNGLSERCSTNTKQSEEANPRTKHPAKCHIVVPYTEGIGESLKKICKKHGVDMHFKGGRTLKNILVSPKDQDKITSKNSVIYSYSCGSIDCGEEYIGESGRTFRERYKEHQYSNTRTLVAMKHP